MTLIRRVELLFVTATGITHLRLLFRGMQERRRWCNGHGERGFVAEETEGEVGDGDAAEDEGKGEDLLRIVSIGCLSRHVGNCRSGETVP